MTATTAIISIEGKQVQLSDNDLAKLNEYLQTVPASDAYYKKDADFKSGKHLVLKPTLTIEASVE